MGITVNVNKLTVVHAGSNGTSIAFPDVCKTPSPAGPIPIPYPNIARSTDTADGSTTVKVDGNPIMLKGSNFRMSTGDEAGAALGVVSNKIKGKAEFTMYSFDVKADGKNVCRLTDPMQQNMGSPGNAFGPAEIQQIILAHPERQEPCENTMKKMEKKKDAPQTRWGESGVLPEDRAHFSKVADEEGVIIYIRQTKKECWPWIRTGHQPKPHSITAGTTIKEEGKVPVARVQEWLNKRYASVSPEEKREMDLAVVTVSSNQYSRRASDYIGIIGSTVESEFGKPLKSKRKKYKNKWVTGDYDLFDVIHAGDKCQRTHQSGKVFARIRKKLNKMMGREMIQHGPQVQWVSSTAKGDDYTFSLPDKSKGWLKAVKKNRSSGKPVPPSPKVPIAEGRTMDVIDTKLTVVAGNGVVIYLETLEDVADCMICCGCADEQ